MQKKGIRRRNFIYISIALAMLAWMSLFSAINLGKSIGHILIVGTLAVLFTVVAFLSGRLYDNWPDKIGWMKLRHDVKGLYHALQPGSHYQAKAANALGAIGKARDADMLFQSITNAGGKVNPYEINALGQIKADNVLNHLHALLASENSEIRRHAVLALEKLKDQRSLEPLLALLNDPSESIAGLAVRALGRIGNERAVEPILKRYEGNPSSDFRYWAVEGLQKFRNHTAVKLAQEEKARLEAERKAAQEARQAQEHIEQQESRFKQNLGNLTKVCIRCGTPLRSIDMARDFVTIVGSLPALLDGVICNACGRLECTKCKGSPLNRPCSWCGGTVSPAYVDQVERILRSRAV